MTLSKQSLVCNNGYILFSHTHHINLPATFAQILSILVPNKWSIKTTFEKCITHMFFISFPLCWFQYLQQIVLIREFLQILLVIGNVVNVNWYLKIKSNWTIIQPNTSVWGGRLVHRLQIAVRSVMAFCYSFTWQTKPTMYSTINYRISLMNSSIVPPTAFGHIGTTSTPLHRCCYQWLSYSA